MHFIHSPVGGSQGPPRADYLKRGRNFRLKPSWPNMATYYMIVTMMNDADGGGFSFYGGGATQISQKPNAAAIATTQKGKLLLPFHLSQDMFECIFFTWLPIHNSLSSRPAVNLLVKRQASQFVQQSWLHTWRIRAGQK